MSESKQLAKILGGKLWRFFGGIKPNDRKKTTDTPIEELPIPSLITLPLDRHLGRGGEILVSVGDHVKAGQPLTSPGGGRNVPLHASTSGEVIGINMQVLPHPSEYMGRCITIKPDGLDTKVPDDPIVDWQERTPQELLQRVRAYGVEGLGGAQFQTAAKISAALDESVTENNIFIVNGAECEPVATCDDRLMQEKAQDIAQGIEVVRHILKPKVIIVAIEDNKPKAIEAMKKAVAKDVLVRVIPTLYPSGAARNLIKICTGIEIPYSEHTSECGIVVDNVETVYAIKQAVIDGIPLIRRVVTVDGQTLGKTGNAFVRLGTSVRFVLNNYKLKPENKQRIILGGPFMGFTLPTIDVPVTKSTTCIFVPSQEELASKPEQMNCIRCGRCARVCPSRLVPYQLYALSKAKQHSKTKECGMMDCTECGCCSYVCPSRIPLTHQFRYEKASLRLLADQQRRNVRAQERMQARQERLAKEELERQKKKEAALARAKMLKESEANLSDEEKAKRRAEQVAAARARAQARRNAVNANQASSTQDNVANVTQEVTNTESIAENKPAQSATTLNLELENNVKNTEQEMNTELNNGQGKQDVLPFNLNKNNAQRSIPKIFSWPEIQEKEKDLSKVENPPKEGEIIPTSSPKQRSYLYASKTIEKKVSPLPRSLYSKEALERKEKEKQEQNNHANEVKHDIKQNVATETSPLQTKQEIEVVASNDLPTKEDKIENPQVATQEPTETSKVTTQEKINIVENVDKAEQDNNQVQDNPLNAQEQAEQKLKDLAQEYNQKIEQGTLKVNELASNSQNNEQEQSEVKINFVEKTTKQETSENNLPKDEFDGFRTAKSTRSRLSSNFVRSRHRFQKDDSCLFAPDNKQK